MIAACMRADAEAQERVRPQLAAVARTRVKRYIEAKLAAPDLTPETICADLGLSRSSLYRLFDSEGGVARFIQDRRLARIRASLQDPEEPRSIGALAEAYGFRSRAHFSRSFRALFDLSPQDLRQQSRQVPSGSQEDQGDLRHWIDLLGL
ncbi:helix-turn-helix domain-containing protein [Fodinicurvata halophila]